jgi:inhibitor of cysteine peptidase
VAAGEASVESIEILILESFPVQVHALVKGNMPDTCTEIDQINRHSDLENNTFWVEITTVRPTNVECTTEVVPFEEIIALDVYGLPAGVYTVDVNDVTDTFTLDMDNVPE